MSTTHHQAADARTVVTDDAAPQDATTLVDFVGRHVGPREAEIATMLQTLGYDSLEALVEAAVPEAIRSRTPLSLQAAPTEQAVIAELRELALDLAPHAADGDAEDALPAADEVDDLVVAGALVDAGAVAHEGDLGEVLHAALTQRRDCHPDLLEGDTGVEEPFDDLEHEDVAEAVQPLGAGAARVADGGLQQAGAGPVVQLAVGDARGSADGGAAVADGLVEGRRVLREEHPLGGPLGPGLHLRAGGVDASVHRSSSSV